MAYNEKYRKRTLEYRHEGHTLAQTKKVFKVSAAFQRGSQIIAPLQYKGIMHAVFFEACFEQELIPLLTESTVVIMHNFSFHRKNFLNDIAPKYGIKIIFARAKPYRTGSRKKSLI